MDDTHPIKINFEIPSILGHEKIVRNTVREFAAMLDYAPREADRIRTSVSEACINAIEHGNGNDPARRVRVAVVYCDPDLTIEVADEGEGLKGEPPKPDMARKMAGEEEARGWGVFLMRKMMDTVQFERTDEGSLVRLTKIRRPEEE